MAGIFNNRDPEFYISGILNGNVAILSRAITLVESRNDSHRALAQKIVDGVISRSGNSFRLGITGVPGVGKSTFIESFGKTIVNNGHKLAVLAVDPSSTKSKGSILGDKTRMERLSTDKNVFIRPSPSSGALGGVTGATFETILLCEAAGFDFIIVETVGVGQSETEVGKITDFFLLLMLAGAGDELQGIKRGIMEMADALVITKADGENLLKAKSARAEYAHAMHLLQAPESGWTARTMITSSLSQEGIAEVYSMITEYRQFVTNNGYFYQKRKTQQYALFIDTLQQQLTQRFFEHPQIAAQIEAFKSLEHGAQIQPFLSAQKILDGFFKERLPAKGK